MKGLVLPGPAAQLAHEGKLTQWRVPIKPQPPEDYSVLEVGLYHPTLVDRHGEEYPGAERFGAWTLDGECGWPCPFGAPGASLYVREPWYCDDYRVQSGPYEEQDDWTTEERGNLLYYKGRDSAGNGLTHTGFSLELMRNPWRSTTQMPRWASRTLLELESVEVSKDELWVWVLGLKLAETPQERSE